MQNFQLINWFSKIAALCEIKIESSNVKGPINSFLAIPNKKNARFILPLQNGYKGYWQGLYLYPAIYPKLMAKKCLTVLFGSISIFFKNNRLTITCQGNKNAAQNLYALLSTNEKQIDQIESFALRMGSAGAGFKLIFQFQNKEGHTISYIKVGDPSNRGIFLQNEKSILQYLDIFRSTVVIPSVLGYKSHCAFSALEIAPIPKIRYYPRPHPEKVAALLGNLCKCTANKEYKRETQKNISLVNLDQYLKKEKTINFVRSSIDYLYSNNYPRPLTHRDLGGWNLCHTENGQLAILDWEFCEMNHLPFQDLFHYFLHTSIHNSKLSPVDSYIKIFKKNNGLKKAINIYADMINVKDPELIKRLRVGYLWDWYSLEKSRAEDDQAQGHEYLEILNWLAENENSY